MTSVHCIEGVADRSRYSVEESFTCHHNISTDRFQAIQIPYLNAQVLSINTYAMC